MTHAVLSLCRNAQRGLRRTRHGKGTLDVNLKNQPPIFMLAQYHPEIEKLSKAPLMDMVWDYAMQMCGASDDDEAMKELRDKRDLILDHRRQEFRAGAVPRARVALARAKEEKQ